MELQDPPQVDILPAAVVEQVIRLKEVLGVLAVEDKGELEVELHQQDLEYLVEQTLEVVEVALPFLMELMELDCLVVLELLL